MDDIDILNDSEDDEYEQPIVEIHIMGVVNSGISEFIGVKHRNPNLITEQLENSIDIIKRLS